MKIEIDVWGAATAGYLRNVRIARSYRSVEAARRALARIDNAIPDSCHAAHPIEIYINGRRRELPQP